MVVGLGQARREPDGLFFGLNRVAAASRLLESRGALVPGQGVAGGQALDRPQRGEGLSRAAGPAERRRQAAAEGDVRRLLADERPQRGQRRVAIASRLGPDRLLERLPEGQHVFGVFRSRGMNEQPRE